MRRLLRAYRLRLMRKRRQVRAWRRGRQLRPLADRTGAIRPGDILLFACLRNEAHRLDHFLSYYRGMGVRHFLFVDNGSEDGGGARLAAEPDCSVWQTGASYRRARFGMDWINSLLTRHGCGHWVLVVDLDEFLVYPHCDTRPLRALTDWLDASSVRSYGTMLIDLYPDGPPGNAPCPPGGDPVAAAPWFDSGNYVIGRDPVYGNLWIRGGPRQRVLFAASPALAPALNKIPLVKWRWGYVYASSTHALLPRGLNLVYDEWGGEKPCGALLHAKFLADLGPKVVQELERGQHYAASREYRACGAVLAAGGSLRTACSSRYRDWRQLHDLGLISAGGWL